MTRQRVSDLDAEVRRRLRLVRDLSDGTAAKARDVASLWMEEDCRDCMLRGAPAEVERALRPEYRETGFYAESVRAFDNEYRSAE